MRRYEVNIIIAGEGEKPEEAWSNAIESFSLDEGCCPDDYKVEEVDEESNKRIQYILTTKIVDE